MRAEGWGGALDYSPSAEVQNFTYKLLKRTKQEKDSFSLDDLLHLSKYHAIPKLGELPTFILEKGQNLSKIMGLGHQSYFNGSQNDFFFLQALDASLEKLQHNPVYLQLA